MTAKADEKSAERLREGPEGEVLADIRILDAVSARLKRRLFALASSPADLPPAVIAASTIVVIKNCRWICIGELFPAEGVAAPVVRLL